MRASFRSSCASVRRPAAAGALMVVPRRPPPPVLGLCQCCVQMMRRVSCAAAAPSEPAADSKADASASAAPRKGDFVRGTVAAIDSHGATIALASGHMGKLSWRNFSKKERRFDDPVFYEKILSAGEPMWVAVLHAPHGGAQALKLSTAALEVRPGDMWKRRADVFAAMDEWDSSGDGVTLQEWRGARELDAMLANMRGRRAHVANYTDPATWGLPAFPLPGRGDIVRGTVTGVTHHGVFLSIADGHTGLVPLSQVSKTFTDEDDAPNVVAVGAQLFAVIKSVEDAPQPSSRRADADADADDVGTEDASQSRPRSANARRYVLSLRMLEDEDGLIKESADAYNEHAAHVHARFSRGLMHSNVAAARELSAEFAEAVREWRDGAFELARGSITKGVVLSLTRAGAFVRMEHGPTALLHVDALSHAKFRDMGSLLKQGDTVYGRVYNVPANTQRSAEPGASSPSSYWLSVKELERNSPGFLVRSADKFWASAAAKHAQQAGQQSDRKPRATITMHRGDLELTPLISALQHLEYVPWHALAGRPNPGLLLSRGATDPSPPVAQWSEPDNELIEEYDELRCLLQDASRHVVPASVSEWLLTEPHPRQAGLEHSDDAVCAEGGTRPSPEASHVTTAADTASAASSSGPTGMPPSVLRHAWTTSRMPHKAVAAKLATLRLRAAAIAAAQHDRRASSMDAAPADADSVPRRGDVSGSTSSPASADETLESAAASLLLVARLVGGARASPLVGELFSVFRMLGRRLPGSLTPALLAWGESMFGGPARDLVDSRLLELLACEGIVPPAPWAAAAFKLAYKDISGAPPDDVLRYFRLMHALGHRVSSNAWWDRTLQQLAYNDAQPRSAMSRAQHEELRGLVAELRQPLEANA